jgi:hypothetical protein
MIEAKHRVQHAGEKSTAPADFERRRRCWEKSRAEHKPGTKSESPCPARCQILPHDRCPSLGAEVSGAECACQPTRSTGCPVAITWSSGLITRTEAHCGEPRCADAFLAQAHAASNVRDPTSSLDRAALFRH